MNSKPTILVSENQTVFQSFYFEEVWEPYFNIEIIDINKKYDKSSTVVVSNWISFEQKTNLHEQYLHNNGIRHVIDHCWDCYDNRLDNSADFTLRPKDFMWFNESIWYKHLGYDKFNLTRNPTRDFLMLINDQFLKLNRMQLYNRLEPMLANNIYSYVGKGIPLQNAKDQPYNLTTWQRYTDPNWYTTTRFSIVSETATHHPENIDDFINVTEKTLKPCAFKHPSIIWGQAGTLAWQKRQGFETFGHCIDESYDTVEDESIRFEKVIEQIEYCLKDKTIFNDSLTQQKLEHNYNHFYNEEIVMKLIHKQVINPLLEFINA